MLAGLDAYLSGVVAHVFSGKKWDCRHYCNLSRSLGADVLLQGVAPLKLRGAVFLWKHPLGDCRDWADRVI
jgi:hypothetical protein